MGEYFSRILSLGIADLMDLEPWRYWVVLAPLGFLLLVCTYTDFKEKKVYNKWTYPFAGVGILCHTMAFGLDGLVAGLLGGIIAFAVGLLLFVTNGMRGGDVKLLTVVGIFLGSKGVGSTFFYSMIAGGVGGLLVAAYNGYLWVMLKRIGKFIWGIIKMIAYQTAMVREKLEVDERSWLPFSIYVLIGVVLTWTDAMFDWPGLLEMFLMAWKV